MKKPYPKPMFMVEYNTLTQAIAVCGNIKVGFADSACADSANMMRDWAGVGGFIQTTVTGRDSCSLDLSGFTEGSVDDLMCYFTSINAAFVS